MLNHNLFFHADFKLNGISFLGITDLLFYIKKQDKAIYTFLKQWFDNELFIGAKTSGSTGKPKLIQLEKKAMVASALATGKHFDLPAKTSAFLCLSSDYIAGKMMLVRAMVLGWHLDILETNSSPLKSSSKHYDFGAMVPLQVHHSLEDLKHVKKLIIGGGTIASNLLIKIYKLDTACYATYGMTETITHVAVKELVESNNYYTVLPNIDIQKDIRNCLVIKAPQLTQEPVITNDLVEISNANQFKWLGRYDSIINSGGIKIIPEQVEEKLSKYIKTRFFISSIPDEKLGEKIILIVESKPFSFDKELFKKTLTKYEIPKAIYFMPQFVETENKKIQRQKTLDLRGY
jgi:O-succinylbenzoic acid--CoA ligase